MVGMLFGTFDGLHAGHVFLVHNALARITYTVKNRKYDSAKTANVAKPNLYIVVGRDATVAKVKGRPPQRTEKERAQELRTLFPEATVVLGHRSDYMHWVHTIRPDLIFLGYDQVAFVDVLENELRRIRVKSSTNAAETLRSKTSRGNSLVERSDPRTFSRDVLRESVSSEVVPRIVRLKSLSADTYKSSKLKKHHVIIRGTVVDGHKKGRSIGYPTANIHLSKAMKAVITNHALSGIYASRVLLGGTAYIGATIVGARCEKATPLVETHILGFGGDCYGETVAVTFEKKLRECKKYTSTASLIADIKKDIERVQQFFA
jgi:FAD synthase